MVKKIKYYKKWISQDIIFIKQHMKTVFYKNRIILFDTADHNNLGDHAIAMAEIEFIRKYLPKYRIIEVPGGNILRHTLLYKLLIRDTDIVTIAGGGFLGSLWEFEEVIVQCILENFCNNKIIIFPQTFFVEDTMKDFMFTHKGYLKHPNLTICLRDKKSCNRLLTLAPQLKKNFLYMPDMVCGLSVKNISMKRKNIAICFREDKEGILDNDNKTKLFEKLKSMGEEVEFISTIANKNIDPKYREVAVYSKLSEIASKKLIITDRLHAMLFSAITGTPCIAMDNKSGKVAGVYDWIRQQPYIFFTKDMGHIFEILETIDLKKNYKFDSKFVDKYWKKLSNIIMGEKYE